MTEIIKSGIMVVTVLIIRKAGWNRITRKTQYCLWIFVVFYLLFGSFIGIKSRYGIDGLFAVGKDIIATNLSSEQTDQNKPASYNVYFSRKSYMQYENSLPNENDYTVMAEKSSRNKNKSILSLAKQSDFLSNPFGLDYNFYRWIVASIAAGFVIVINTVFVINCVTNRIPIEKNEETGLNVYTLENIDTPFLLGRDIYVNKGITIDMPEYRHMIIHEYCHYKNGDYLWVLIRQICLIVNWYNPFAWIAYSFMKRDCELACDEAVLAKIGLDKRKEYGYTLLSLAKIKQNRISRLNISTSMSANFKNLKERIEKISGKDNNKCCVTVLAVVVMFLITWWLLLQNTVMANEANSAKSEKAEESSSKYVENQTEKNILSYTKTISDKQGFFKQSEENDNSDATVGSVENDLTYNYYNSVKYYNGFFYYSDTEGLKRINRDLTDSQVIAEGGVKLGNADNGYIYYIRYPNKEYGNTGICRIDTTNLSEEVLIAWNGEMAYRSDNWLCRNVYAVDSVVYLEYNDRCEAYRIDNSRHEEIENGENIIYSYMIDCGINENEINEMMTGYLNTCFKFDKIIKCVPKDEKYNIEIYDIKTRGLSDRIEGCEIGALVTDKGLVYTTEDSKVYLRTWDNGESTLLYNTYENSNQDLAYGTYDTDYLYGFIENDNGLTLKAISWDGTVLDKTRFDGGMKDIISLGYSINNGIQSYWQNGKIVFETL